MSFFTSIQKLLSLTTKWPVKSKRSLRTNYKSDVAHIIFSYSYDPQRCQWSHRHQWAIGFPVKHHPYSMVLSSWSNKVPLRTQLLTGVWSIRQTIGQMVWVMRKKARPYDTVFLLSCSIFHKMCGWLFCKVTSRYVYIQIRLKLPTANCRAILHCISHTPTK